MPAKVIGKFLNFGFAGTPSRMSDCVIAPYTFPVVAATDGTTIAFGEPVVFDKTIGGVRKIKTGDTATDVIGFAVRKVSQPHADNVNGWFYEPGDDVDVMLRGSITVGLEATTGIAARGAVYVDAATGKVYAATASGRLAIGNAFFATGKADTEGVAEITLTERVI